MSYIHSEYGKEIKIFTFDGSHRDQNQDVILINVSFIIYEKGLLIKGLAPLTPFYIKWRQVSGVILYQAETTKVTIELKDGADEIVAESKDAPENVIEFYEHIEAQREKYRYFDELKQLKVDMEDISIIMDTDSYENQAYFDTLTGDTIYIPADLNNEDNVYDEKYVANLPKWEREMVDQVKAIYEDEDRRFIFIPKRDSFEAYDIMVQFVKKLDDIDISEELFDALDGKGAFRRFKNVIKRYPKIEKQWYKYKEEADKQEVREWLWSIGIEPIEV